MLAALLALLPPAPPASAHEMQAAISDIDLVGGRVVLAMRANLEAMIAGVGSGHDDTDESPVAAEYDALRALPPEALEERFRAFAPELLDAVEMTAGGASVPLAVEGVSIDPVGDLLLVRDTRITLTGVLPDGARTATIRMDPKLGDLIVRGTGENSAYGEFLQEGATSRPIPIVQGGMLDAVARFLGLGD